VDKQEIWFVINPIAGGKKNSEQLQKSIESQLDISIYSPKFFRTEYQGHATQIACQALQKNIKFIVAVGGDGTVNEIAQVLRNTSSILGIIPRGSGNGLARDLGIPMSIRQAIMKINNPILKRIDTCFINDIPFFCTAGVGFDAHCAEKFSSSKNRGLLTYIRVVLNEIFQYKPLTITLSSLSYEVLGITFANTKQFGNNAMIAPLALNDDGLLDITIINKASFWQILRLGIDLFNKNILKHPNVENYRASSIAVELLSPALIHFDGEPKQLDDKNLFLKVEEKSLQVIV